MTLEELEDKEQNAKYAIAEIVMDCEAKNALREGKTIRIVNNLDTTYHLNGGELVTRTRNGNILYEYNSTVAIIPFADAFDWEVVE